MGEVAVYMTLLEAQLDVIQPTVIAPVSTCCSRMKSVVNQGNPPAKRGRISDLPGPMWTADVSYPTLRASMCAIRWRCSTTEAY